MHGNGPAQRLKRFAHSGDATEDKLSQPVIAPLLLAHRAAMEPHVEEDMLSQQSIAPPSLPPRLSFGDDPTLDRFFLPHSSHHQPFSETLPG